MEISSGRRFCAVFPTHAFRCLTCGKMHKLQVLLPHAVHVNLQRIAKDSKYGNIGDFIIFHLLDILGMKDHEEVKVTPIPKRIIRVRSSDLCDSPVSELRRFAKEQGLDPKGKKQDIVADTFASDGIDVIDDVGLPTCEFCQKVGHREDRCNERRLRRVASPR